MANKPNKPSEQVSADVVYDEFDRFEIFITDNWRRILYASGAVIVIVTIAAIIIQVNKSNQYKAESKLADAKTEKELQSAIKKYPGIPATNAARLRLAMIYKDAKKFDEAVAVLQKIAKTEKSNDLQWRALLNIGFTMELAGKKEQAATHFAELGSGKYPDTSETIRDEANYSAGRIYFALNNSAKAQEVLQIPANASTDGPAGGFWKGQAKKLLNRIKYGQAAAKQQSVEVKSATTEAKK